jgi:hypothetical protein
MSKLIMERSQIGVMGRFNCAGLERCPAVAFAQRGR